MIRVLVAADSPLIRAGLEALLRDAPSVGLVRSVDGALPLAEEIESAGADVLVLETAVPEVLPLPLAYSPDATARAPAIVLLGDFTDSSAVTALRSGARAVLPRSATPEEIIAAVEAAAAGLIALPASLGGALLDHDERSAAHPDPSADSPPLTPRELQVLRLLAEGMGNKRVAARLGISDHTVKAHVASILMKLHASTRAEAVAIGARMGLILL